MTEDSISVAMVQEQSGKLTGRLQAGSTNEESINIGLLRQLLAVLLIHASAIQDTGGLADLWGDLGSEELANGGMNVLSLLGCCNLACSNGPGIC
jgi:hypothetical protein